MARNASTFDQRNGWIWPTDVADYSLCPWRVFYKRVIGIYLEATAPMARGWMEHEARRRFYSSIMQSGHARHCEVSDADSLADECVTQALNWALLGFQGFPRTLREHADVLRLSLSDEALRISRGLKFNSAMAGFLIPVGLETSYLDPDLGVKGRIDIIYDTSAGLIPCDIKTGEFDSASMEAYTLQVATYALLLEYHHGTSVKHGILRYSTMGFDFLFEISNGLRSKVLTAILGIRTMFQSRNPPQAKRLTLPYCSKCGYLSLCRRLVNEAEGTDSL